MRMKTWRQRGSSADEQAALDAWHLFLMSDGCTEAADNLVVTMFVGETNKGHGLVIVVGHMVCIK